MSTFIIPIHVGSEDELYNHFDKSHRTLSGDLLDYISEIYTEKHYRDPVALEFTGAPIDEERLTSALRGHVEAELEKNRKQRKLNNLRQLRLFLIGLAFVVAGILLGTVLNSILLELLSIVGSFAVWEAANIWIVENPKAKLREKFLNRLLTTEIIIKGDDAT